LPLCISSTKKNNISANGYTMTTSEKGISLA